MGVVSCEEVVSCGGDGGCEEGLLVSCEVGWKVVSCEGRGEAVREIVSCERGSCELR